MRLSLRRLNRATLARQLLLERHALPVVDAVRRLVALQAQEPVSPYLALWSRLEGFDAAELDAAFRSYAVVKASLLRNTLHAVAAEDRPAFHAAMRPTLRAAGLNDRRFRASGLSDADSEALVPKVVAFARRPRSRAEIETLLSEDSGAAGEPGVWRALRMIAPLVHAPADEPWSFGRSPRFVAAPRPHALVDPPSPGDVTAAVARLVRRNLAAFGPASRRDFAQFALLRQAEAGPAFDALADALVALEGPGGATLHDVPDAPAPPRLLAMWDSRLPGAQVRVVGSG